MIAHADTQADPQSHTYTRDHTHTWKRVHTYLHTKMRGFLHVQICFNISIDLKTIKKHRKNEKREKGGWKKFVPEMFDIISYNCLLEIEKYSIQIHTFIKENLF